MKIKIFEILPSDEQQLYSYKDFDDALSVTESNGSYVVILKKEDYFGKLVYLYDVERFKIEICDTENLNKYN